MDTVRYEVGVDYTEQHSKHLLSITCLAPYPALPNKITHSIYPMPYASIRFSSAGLLSSPLSRVSLLPARSFSLPLPRRSDR